MIILIIAAIIISTLLVVSSLLRRVVSTNEVHIIQSRKKTTSYGKDMTQGNIYYEWPYFLPIIGITKTILPVSVFDLDLTGYEAYDKGRLPFVVDIKAFFRITNSDIAAQCVSSFEELQSQLKAVVQGAVRTILASNEIEEIMQGRSKFGNEFTAEVEAQLSNWGVSTVKNIEMMDIRDHQGSQVIKNIMDKKKSHIEMESRTEVANNLKIAKIAEIQASQETEMKNQEASQIIGQKKAETAKYIGISEQKAVQEIKYQETLTKETEMNLLRVGEIKNAEIEKDKKIVEAQQQRESSIILAEGDKLQNITKAQGNLEAQRLGAQGIEVEGKAKAEAEKAMQLAPISAQIELAKEIGSNKDYQEYLITIRTVEANQAIGMKQAEALKEAELKIIANGDSVGTGINKLTEVFSSKGGTNIAGMLEGLAQSEQGKSIINKFLGKENGSTK